LQDQARRLQKEPREEDEKKIDNERLLLGVQLAKFLAARPYVAANGVIINIDSSENPPECFDNFDNDGTTWRVNDSAMEDMDAYMECQAAEVHPTNAKKTLLQGELVEKDELCKCK